MTDDLERLKAALEQATPQPNSARRTETLALAKKDFIALQGISKQPRPMETRPRFLASFIDGVSVMLGNIGLHPRLLASTGIVALGVGLFITLPVETFLPGNNIGITEKESLDDQMAEPLVVEEIADSQPTLKRKQSEVSTDMAAQAPLPLVAAEGKVLGGNGAIIAQPEDRERFSNAESNPLKITAEEPVSTFSIDVDTASYAYVRARIENGFLPEKDAVRVEEMINYFPYDYAEPTGEHPFSTHVSTMQTPWNSGTQLLHIGIQGQKINAENRPPLDLVFLIDTSGSMSDANKLPLLKKSFRLLLASLTENDQIAIVTYAGSSGLALRPTKATDKAAIMAAFDRLSAGGSTAGAAGLQQAYQTAEQMASDGRLGRVILATDGDFNVGISDPSALKNYIAEKRESGTYLSVLGFGRGNYNDALMQSLAQNGNGTAAYIDTLSEAQKVLVDQASGALFPIADDVKIQVEFNPAMIAEYRLIGYETRLLDRTDFNNDRVDAGDIGAGHSVTAIYEITPVGSDAVKSDPLRYQASEPISTSDELAFVKLRYKSPGETKSVLIETPVTSGMDASSEAQFGAAIAGFGQLLRGSDKIQSWSFDAAIELANANKGSDAYGYRSEAIRLMRLAKSLSK